jgi:ferrochelatase
VGSAKPGCYEALLVVGFGGPEAPEEVLPFLERVTAGRRVPRARLEEVAQHYLRFGGASPVNGQMRALAEAVRAELAARGLSMPVYLGHRFARPSVAEALARMATDGIRRAVAFVPSVFCSPPSCGAYLEATARARSEVGPSAPVVDGLGHVFRRAGFLDAVAASVERARAALADRGARAHVVFLAHSIPVAAARISPYAAQLSEASALVAERLASRPPYSVAFQSRSGPPEEAWLEPDVSEHLAALARAGTEAVVLAPIGFVSDHMEVRYDLDVVACASARRLGLACARAATVGTDPSFVGAVVDMVTEALAGSPPHA